MSEVRKAAKAVKEFLANFETLSPVLDRLASEDRQVGEVEGRLSILKAELQAAEEAYEAAKKQTLDQRTANDQMQREADREAKETKEKANVAAASIIATAEAEAAAITTKSKLDKANADAQLDAVRHQVEQAKKDLAVEQEKLASVRKEIAAARRKLETV